MWVDSKTILMECIKTTLWQFCGKHEGSQENAFKFLNLIERLSGANEKLLKTHGIWT